MPQNAQVAELVDALVSNTNAFGRAGSTPALGTKSEEFLAFLFSKLKTQPWHHPNSIPKEWGVVIRS